MFKAGKFVKDNLRFAPARPDGQVGRDREGRSTRAGPSRTRSRSSRRSSCPRASSPAAIEPAAHGPPGRSEQRGGAARRPRGRQRRAGRAGRAAEVDSLGDDKHGGRLAVHRPRPEVAQLQGDGQEGLELTTSAPSTPGCRARSRSSSRAIGPARRRGRRIARGLAAARAAGPRGGARPGRRRTPRRATSGSRPSRRPGTPSPTPATRSTARTFDPRADDLPDRRLPRATRKDWRKPVTLAYERRAGAAQLTGPLIRARVGDKLRIHFKNLDTLRDAPHSMHFHGVEYEPSSDGIYLPLHSGKGGDVMPGQDVHLQAHGRPRLGRRLALPRPLAVDGGVDRRRHVRRALDRRARRAARRTASSSSRSRRWHGFQTIDGRAFVGNTPVFRAKRRRDASSGT